MVAVAPSSDAQGSGSTPGTYSSASDASPRTNRRAGPMPASASSSSGSTSSTEAPEWSRM